MGAQAALKLAWDRQLKLALLKSRSPSCGNAGIYSGAFDGKRVPGVGVTTALLQQNGIQVFNETQLDALERALVLLDTEPTI